MDKKIKAALEIYDAANELLRNLYDADQHVVEGTNMIHPDISRLEKALAALNKTFELGKE